MDIELWGHRFSVVVDPRPPDDVIRIMPFGPGRIWDEDPDAVAADFRGKARCVISEPS
jgi:hypothetical protein